jgi:DNA-binding protein HU-beta
MTNEQIIIAIAEKAGTKKSHAKKLLSEFVRELTETLSVGESVTVGGLGTFKIVERAGRPGRDPRTGAELWLPEHKAVKFTPCTKLKELVK